MRKKDERRATTSDLYLVMVMCDGDGDEEGREASHNVRLVPEMEEMVEVMVMVMVMVMFFFMVM